MSYVYVFNIGDEKWSDETITFDSETRADCTDEERNPDRMDEVIHNYFDAYAMDIRRNGNKWRVELDRDLIRRTMRTRLAETKELIDDYLWNFRRNISIGTYIYKLKYGIFDYANGQLIDDSGCVTDLDNYLMEIAMNTDGSTPTLEISQVFYYRI